MTLMILSHPNFEQSIANKTIVTELIKQQHDLEVRHIYELYPDYQIDIAAEQAALLRHDLIILQYPMYWFNMPAILKIWFDQVFSYQFAYGSKGDKLKHKKLLASLTVGQPEQNFIVDQKNHLMQSFLKAVQASAQYAQMDYVDPVFLYDISTAIGHSEIQIQAKAKAHSQHLNTLINTLHQSKK
ncbi:NAD(P)H-dependent oxidoreductase [Acinetobacter puyangensis]|uniref:Glutathione-regulated potassium-efflux system ancillary protein KefF n=1 Tax=Acinetobacter puyangensis TaxID=1096779 RepID=A0A240E449_9GAMM|nr:NAD(P)H-dependent oxidoreductase [Acinetobacter puyangensis]SNX42979.1 glutathione-regulated potassium-efflux system ancillary protein KefF [Acinetobacter puyangensis]